MRRLARDLVAVAVLLGLSCTANPRAVRSVHAPGPKAGTESFVVDEMMFVGPSWPFRIEVTDFVMEAAGDCREVRFTAPPAFAGKSMILGHWAPTNSCTRLSIHHLRDFFPDGKRCEKDVAEQIEYGTYRYFSDVQRSRLSLAGRAATRDELTWGLGTEAARAVMYQVCWGDGKYVIIVGGLVSRNDEIDLAHRLLITSLRWVDPEKVLGPEAPASR